MLQRTKSDSETSSRMCHPIHRPQPHQPISSTLASASPSSSLLTCASRAALNPVKVTPDLLSNVLRNAVHLFWHDQRRSDSAHNMIAGVWSTKIWPGTLLAPYTVTFFFDHSVGGNWVRPLPQPHVTEITFRAVWWRDTEEVPFTTAALPVALQVIPRKHGLLEQLTFDKCKFHDREQLVALSVILAKPEFIRKLSFRNCSVGLGPVGVFEALPHTELVPLWKLEFPDLTNSMIALGLSHPYRKPRIILQRLSLTVSNPQGQLHLDHLPPLLLHLNDCRSLEICFKCAFRELAVMCRRPLGNGTALPRSAQPPRDRKVSITWVGPSHEVVRFGEWARKDMQFWVDTWLYLALNVSPPHLAARLEVTSQE